MIRAQISEMPFGVETVLLKTFSSNKLSNLIINSGSGSSKIKWWAEHLVVICLTNILKHKRHLGFKNSSTSVLKASCKASAADAAGNNSNTMNRRMSREANSATRNLSPMAAFLASYRTTRKSLDADRGRRSNLNWVDILITSQPSA